MECPTRFDNLHIVYISRLASIADYRAFAAICRTARVHNPTLGVGGVLLFDGERFCQWLHGSAAAVETMMAKIALDHRHTDLQLLHHASMADDRSDSGWCCGFVSPDALDVLDRAGPERNDAMGTFMRLLATADLEPSLELDGTRATARSDAAQSCRGGA